VSAAVIEVDVVIVDARLSPVRDFYCPICGRWVFKSTAQIGLTQHRCKSCGKKTWFDHAKDYPRRAA
jgi:tRNA(Ile2) C34 agmatinyltransferase TiaS